MRQDGFKIPIRWDRARLKKIVTSLDTLGKTPPDQVNGVNHIGARVGLDGIAANVDCPIIA